MAEIRLNRFLASAGVASRRAADILIAAGDITINGKRVTKLGTIIDPERDKIGYKGKRVTEVLTKRVYLFYKPRGVISTMKKSRETGRTLSDVMRTTERLFPVGRLDRESEGLMLLTNDGMLANRLMHPRYEHEKEYIVTVDKTVEDKHIQRLRAGMKDGRDKLQAVSVQKTRDKEITIILAMGKKHHVRRMCSAVGLQVNRLVRVRIGQFTLGTMKPGEWKEAKQNKLSS